MFRRRQNRQTSQQYSTQSARDPGPSPLAYSTSGNINNNHDRSNIRVADNIIYGSQHVPPSHNSSTTTRTGSHSSSSSSSSSHNTQHLTTVFSHNTDSNYWDSNNFVKGNVGSFNGTDIQQIMSSSGPNAMPLPAQVPGNFTSGSWYSNNHNSNHTGSGNIILNNRDSFNATAQERFTANSANIYQSLRNQANPRESHHQSTTSHNSRLPGARRQSASTVWSNNVNSNDSDSNNRIEGNVGVSINQNPISAITGARVRNNPLAQNVPLDLSAAGDITTYSHNKNSNSFNSRNNILNNTDSFNSAGVLNRRQGLNFQVEQVVAICRSLGYNDEALQDLRLESWHHEVLKLCPSDGGRTSADQPAHDLLHQLMEKILRHREKGHKDEEETQSDSESEQFEDCLEEIHHV